MKFTDLFCEHTQKIILVAVWVVRSPRSFLCCDYTHVVCDVVAPPPHANWWCVCVWREKIFFFIALFFPDCCLCVCVDLLHTEVKKQTTYVSDDARSYGHKYIICPLRPIVLWIFRSVKAILKQYYYIIVLLLIIRYYDIGSLGLRIGKLCATKTVYYGSGRSILMLLLFC